MGIRLGYPSFSQGTVEAGCSPVTGLSSENGVHKTTDQCVIECQEVAPAIGHFAIKKLHDSLWFSESGAKKGGKRCNALRLPVWTG